MKLMNDFEVVEFIKNGGKAKRVNWRNGFYIYYDSNDSVIRDENDTCYNLTLSNNLEERKWEIFDERLELPDGMGFVRNMLWDGSKITCKGVICGECIFNNVDCRRIKDELFQYRNKYKL